MGREQRRGIVREAAAEVGTHEVLLAVLRCAGDGEHGKTERRERAAQLRRVERRMHGIACARMGEAEFEQRRGGERRPAARQRDPRGGEAAQLGPRLVRRRRAARSGVGR